MSFLDSVKLNSLGYLASVNGEQEVSKRVDAGGAKVTKPSVETPKPKQYAEIPKLTPKEAKPLTWKGALAPSHGVTCPVARADYGPDAKDNVALNLEITA